MKCFIIFFLLALLACNAMQTYARAKRPKLCLYVSDRNLYVNDRMWLSMENRFPSRDMITYCNFASIK